jgi:short-subunit dehydrogenase
MMMRTDKIEKFYRDKVVLITGAASGLGRELALALSHFKVKLILLDKNETNLRTVLTQCRYHNKNVESLILDISSLQKTKTILTQMAEHTNIDIVFNNAGIGLRACPSVDIDIEETEQVLKVNFFGNITITNTLIPFFKKNNQTNIVVTSSLSAKNIDPYHSAYSASKHALDGFYNSIRMEIKKYNINITMVYLSSLRTKMEPIGKTMDLPGIKLHLKLKRLVLNEVSPKVAARLMIASASKNSSEIYIGETIPLRFARIFKAISPNFFYRIVGIVYRR